MSHPIPPTKQGSVGFPGGAEGPSSPQTLLGAQHRLHGQALKDRCGEKVPTAPGSKTRLKLTLHI